MTDATNTPTEEQLITLKAFAEGLDRKQLKSIAKGLNKTEEGRKSSGGKHWSQRTVFAGMCQDVLSGQDPDEVLESWTERAKATRVASRENARQEMGDLAAIFEAVG